jgi:hypothetical protein
LLVIDANTPLDGGIWYLDRFAEQADVDDGVAESLNTLCKIRMDIRLVVIENMLYSIGHRDIRDGLHIVHVPFPIPDDFDQDKVYDVGANSCKPDFGTATWVTATSDELERSTDSKDLENFRPQPDIVYRLKKDVARHAGLKRQWIMASEASEEVVLPDGEKKRSFHWEARSCSARTTLM